MSHATFLEKLLDLSARQAVGRQEDGEVCLSGRQVEWLPLGDLTEYEQPTKYLVKTRNYSDEFSTPVLTAGKTFVLGYTDETDGIYKASGNPVIIFDDFTSANKWVDFDFKAKSSAMKMVTSSDEGKLSLRYLYHWLNTLPSGLIDGDHKRQWISNYSYKKIPIPCPENPERSLAIQAEIVRVLDAFTELTAELTAELAARRKQYNYYRDQLLTFEDGEVEWGVLDEVADVFDSLHKTPQYSDDGLSMVRVTDIKGGFINLEKTLKVSEEVFIEFTKKYLPKENDLVMSRVGSYGNVGIVPSTDTVCMGQNTVVIKSHINSKFLYHFFQSSVAQSSIEKNVGGGSQKTLSLKSIRAIPIPLLNEAEQARIVAILDKLDTLTHSISEGLPREIELRQMQYEYYRDLLLNFPKPEPQTERVA